jgi:hypothetical protein
MCYPSNAQAEDEAKAYFRELYPPDWDEGYDVDRFRAMVLIGAARDARQSDGWKRLGVYELAAKQSAFARSRRLVPPGSFGSARDAEA